jgi:hypothetical protein
MLSRMTDIPIACTLDAAQQRDRARLIDALVEDALIDQQPIDGGLRATFRADDGIEERIRQLVAAESRCCAFLTFDVDRREGVLSLDITGAPDARPVIDEFFAVSSEAA